MEFLCAQVILYENTEVGTRERARVLIINLSLMERRSASAESRENFRVTVRARSARPENVELGAIWVRERGVGEVDEAVLKRRFI